MKKIHKIQEVLTVVGPKVLAEVVSDGVLENIFENPVEGLLNKFVVGNEVVCGPKEEVVSPKVVPGSPIDVVEELKAPGLYAGFDP